MYVTPASLANDTFDCVPHESSLHATMVIVAQSHP
jgi:hypothetical protein